MALGGSYCSLIARLISVKLTTRTTLAFLTLIICLLSFFLVCPEVCQFGWSFQGNNFRFNSFPTWHFKYRFPLFLLSFLIFIPYAYFSFSFLLFFPYLKVEVWVINWDLSSFPMLVFINTYFLICTNLQNMHSVSFGMSCLIFICLEVFSKLTCDFHSDPLVI